MNGLGLYQETAVATQSKEKIVVLLYEGAIKFLKLAVLAIQNSNYENKNKNIQKALDIILELNAVLDINAGEQIAKNLRNLYGFMHRHLVKANIRNNTDMIRDIISLLEELNKGWKSISQ